LRSTITIQEGADDLNRFRTVRIQSVDSDCHPDPTVMLLAPFGFPAEFWQIEDGGPSSGFAQQLALAGYDVWLVDNRLAAADPGECESGAVDCSAMEDWGVQSAVDDALFVRSLVRLASPHARPVIGGFSGGSSVALATINAHPKKFRGLFLWEGTLLTFDPDIQSRNATFCEADRDALDAGVVYDASVQGFQVLFQLATVAPADPTPIPVFPPGTSNLGALLFALTVPDPSNPLNFTDTFIRFAGNPVAETLTHADLNRMLELGPLVGNYAPVAFIRDSHCGMAGSDDSFVDRLDKFRGRALVYSEGLGFNQMMLDTASALTRADVTIDYQPTFAESDRYFNTNWESVALDPLLIWLAEF
jgi:pimeloyl-ACP methyl ester carboxylesterase